MEPTLLAIPAHLKIDNQLYLQVLRRSQSEGPHQRAGGPGGAQGGVAACEPGPMAAWVHGRRRHVTEQQRPEHWLVPASAAAAGSSSGLAAENRAAALGAPPGSFSQQQQEQQHNQKRVVVVAGETTANKRTISTGSSEYQLQFAWPPSGVKNISNTSSAFSHSRRMPESLDSLLNHSQDGEREAAGLLSNSRINNGTGTTTRSQEMVYHAAEELLLNHQQQQQNELSDDQPRRRRYKTEYKKKFRPFSLYQYVDGRFQKSSSDKITTVDGPPRQQQSGDKMDKDTWYGEVLELRKKAGEYKYRGLGGELMSDHMADLYAKQFDVWEQVSRRSSLSALALAATSPRPGSEKVDMASAINSKRGSPAKTAPQPNQSARPGHAQPLVPTSRNKDNNIRNKGSDSTERARRDMSQHRSISSDGSKSRSKSAKPAKSPAQPTTGTGNVTLAVRPSLGAIFHPVSRPPARSASLGPERRMPKSVSSSTTGGNVGSSATKASPVKARPAHSSNEDGKDPVKVTTKNHKDSGDEGKENVIFNEPASSSLPVIEQEPLPALIKALPEPTRVKSPEQLVVRSPDPVNWTVPLDTGKTFTVTQNIRGGEITSRPHSELKVSMTVRPPPAPVASVHSPMIPIVSSSAAAVTKPSEQQQEPLLNSGPAPDDEVPAPCNETEEETSKVAQDETTDEQHPVEENPVDEEKVPVVAEETDPVEILAGEKEEEEEKEELDCKAEESVEAEIKAQEEEEEKEETVKEEEAEEKSMEEIKEIRPAERQDEKSSPVSDPLGAAIVLQGKGPLNEDVPAAIAPVESVTSIVPGTTLRRLEDPTPFLFSRPGTLGSLNAGQQPIAGTSLSDTKPKAPRYRVLEAPGMMSDPVAVLAHPKIHELPKPFQHEPSYEPHPLQSSSAAPMMTSSSPYKGRVLEAPSSPPKSSSSTASAFTSSPSTDSLTSSRSLASDVLEKARTRFDRFWTKKESDK